MKFRDHSSLFAAAEQAKRRGEAVADAPIMAQGITIQSLFMGRRFGIVYYQREYSWSRVDVKALLSDLHQRFIEAWQPTHSTREAQQYPPYFLGSIVYYEENGTTYVVDGQQRITTLHLLLIHLHRLLTDQDAIGDARHVEALFRPNRSDQLFAIDIPEHAHIYESLMKGDPVQLRPNCTPSEKHLAARGRDLNEDFPADLCGQALLPFKEWLLDRVCLAGIRADGRDHGWQIFETTNDRGVRLGPLDLLKSRLLAQAQIGQEGLNSQWRQMLSRLSDVGTRVPTDFIKAYLMANHVRIDDEKDRKQATDAFHEWFRLNPDRLGLNTAHDYTNFIREVCAPLGRQYARIAYASQHWDKDWETIFYNEHNNVPHHLVAMMAALRPNDTDGLAHQKAKLVANYLDLLFVRRLLNNKSVDTIGLEDDILTLVVRLRKCDDLESVRRVLSDETASIGDGFDRMLTFGCTPTNGSQVRYLLARITAHSEEASGRRNTIQDYLDVDHPYEVFHLWSTRFEDHATDVGGRRANFESWRNRLGALLLLSAADHLDLRDQPYTQQLETLRRRHVLAASLDRRTHEDSTFKRWANGAGLTQLLRPFPNQFLRTAIDQRQLLYQRLCTIVWNPVTLGLATDEQRTPATARPEGSHTRTSRPRRKGTNTLAPLVDAGIISVGDALVGTRRKTEYAATVSDKGAITLPTGEIFVSPDEAGAFVLNQKSCIGWGFWHVIRGSGRVSLKDLRTEAMNVGMLD